MMKNGKVLLALCLAFIPLIAYGQTIDYSAIRYAEEHHQKRLELFKAEPIVKEKVIFLGDSIIEYAHWDELLSDPTVINRGIAGDNTFGVLARLEDILTRRPRKLFIEVGINDISQEIPPEIIIENIRTIIRRVKSDLPKAEIYVISVLPTNDNVRKFYPAAFNKNAQVISLNTQLKRNAVKQRFTFVDLNKTLRDRTGALDEKYARSDGLHLNEAGYETLVRLLKTKKYL